MSADLIARYGRRFLQSARERLAAAKKLDAAAAAGANEAREAARALALHLHSISGEAAMIGFSALSERARAAMHVARAVENGASPPGACAAEVAAIGAALDEIERTLP
ncbi:MAG TPA: Hpt domain-containing protein [Polyangia bacterium]|nr:Hpt domain-containing protein [Polyangia bacterium]